MNTRLLIKEIDNLILDSNCHSYFDLCPSDKQALVALYMDCMGKDAFECISESDDLDISVHKLRQFIYFGNTEKAYDLADTLRRNVEKYLNKTLSKIYDERVDTIEIERKHESGLVPYRHKDNGETTWMRA